MIPLIKKAFRQKLNELKLSVHTIERLEDRVWGNKPNGPASINATAWANPDNFPKEPVISVINNKFHNETTPVTNHVKRILDEISFIKNINFENTIDMAIVFWKSSKLETGLGQNPPGNVLVGVLRHNEIVTIQWQPSASVYGGKVTDVDYVIEFDKLQNYITSNNINNITLKDVKKMLNKDKPEQPKKENDIVITINGVKYALDAKNGIFYKKNELNQYTKGLIPNNELYKLDDIFDNLPENIQNQILSKIN